MMDERDFEAAEYVLGLLSGEPRIAAEARLLADPEFARAVDRWQAHLAPLFDEIAAETPARDLWPAIAARLPRPAANENAPRVLPWKIATVGFGSIAAALALMMVVRPDPVPPAPAPTAPVTQPAGDILIAQLVTSDGLSMLAAKLDPADGMRVNVTEIPQGEGEPELWVIPAGGSPVSVGMIPRNGEFSVPLSDVQRVLMQDGATLALTLEPPQGAPHAAPTGDILATARITRL